MTNRMSRSPETQSRPRGVRRAASRRRGGVLLWVLGALVVGVFSAVILFQRWATSDTTEATAQVLVHHIEQGDFVSIVTEAGDIESASNVEVLCEVKSQGGAGTTILEVIDEGTVVKKGDFLLQLDDSVLQLELTQQEIQVATDQALVIQAQSELNKFTQMLSEYEDGLYVMEKETLESTLLQAESHSKSMQDSLDYTQKMFRKGYVSPTELEAQMLAVEMASKAAQSAKTALMVHNKFTRQRMISEYKSEIKKQEALLTAAQYTLKLSQQRRDELIEQIGFCRIVAPVDGQVVYRNDYRRRPPVIIEEGAQIRQGQVIFRLPDPEQMQVDLRINDSKISLVNVGDMADIELDSDPDLRIQGELIEIAPFGRRDWDRGPIRYGALVHVIDPPAALRTGQRCKVHIYIEQRDSVVLAPIQSVLGREENHYCLVKRREGTWDVRQVRVGPKNDSYVVIEDGLDAGEHVALTPDDLWDDVTEQRPAPVEETESLAKPKVAEIGG